MMKTTEDVLTDQDILHLKVAISLALGSPDIVEMPMTKLALNELYHKIERLEVSEQ